MALEPNTFEFDLFLVLTIILLIMKLLLSLYIANVIYRRKKETGEFSFDFITGMFILLICLFVSRLLLFYFDFYLTEFNHDNYTEPSYLIVWRFGMLIYATGFTVILFTVDKIVLDFKFKGIFAYIMLIAGIIQFVYPINTLEDLFIIAGIGLIYGLVAVIIPIIFFYTGNKTPSLRKPAFMIAIGIIFFAIGAILVAEPIIIPLMNMYGNDIQILIFFLFLIFKIIGLSFLAFGVLKFNL